MENEQLILDKINHIEERLDLILKPAMRTQELKDDITPLMNHGVGLLINELLDVGSSFNLNDLFTLVKEAMRSTNDLSFCLKQLGNIIEFLKDIEPLLRSAVPQLIAYLDDLEKRGILRIIKATLDIRAKIAKEYNSDDIDTIGDGLVVLFGLAKKLTDPSVVELIEKLMGIPAYIDLKNVQNAGVSQLMTAGFNKELKAGLGVILELTKAMGRLKN